MNPGLIIAILGGLALMTTRSTPRGIRNNNPGNLARDNVTAWEGLAANQTDPNYWQFVAPSYGIRAMVKTLRTYRDRYGLDTVAGIVARWAPPPVNPTAAYTAAIATALGVAPGAPIDVDARMPALVAAIIRQENGEQPYSADVIAHGIALAD